MKNHEDIKLRQLLQQKLEGLEMTQYDPEWDKMQEKIAHKNFIKKARLTAAALLVLLSAVTAIHYYRSSFISSVSSSSDLAPHSIPPVADTPISISAQSENQSGSGEKKNAAHNALSMSSSSRQNTTARVLSPSEQEEFSAVSGTNEKSITSSGTTLSDPSLNSQHDPHFPSADILLPKNVFCANEEITAESPLHDKRYSNKWYINEEYIQPGNLLRYKSTAIGPLLITLEITDKETRNKIIKTKSVEIRPAPSPSITVKELCKEFNEEYFYNPYYEFACDPSYESYVWDFSNGYTQTGQAVVRTFFEKSGIYDIHLTVSDHYGCKGAATHKLMVDKEYNVFAPNAFTPDNDGLNDVFIPKALENTSVDFSLEILDVKGNVIFRSNENEKAWNGRRNNTEELMPASTYFWTCFLKDKEGILHRWSGQVQLIR